jgi:hypothetical protein
VDYSVPMGVGQGVKNLRGIGERHGEGHGSAKGSSVDILHHQVIRTYIVQDADTGMIQRRYRARLAHETFAELLTGEFQGYGAVQASVARLPDLAHPASVLWD